MKESNFLVDIALKQLQMDHLQNTRRKVMKVQNTLANIAAIKELERDILENTNTLCMKESRTNANIVAMKQLKENKM